MKRLYRQCTKSSPEINFNPETGVLKISGQSYPKNTPAFYQDMFDWLKVYLSTPCDRTVVELNLAYMNTSSTKCLMDIIYMLEDAFDEGANICINWYYRTQNRSMRECGEEIKEGLCMEFNIIAQNSAEE